jgi:formylglycine-generating enzyme required for sulfatase activity
MSKIFKISPAVAGLIALLSGVFPLSAGAGEYVNHMGMRFVDIPAGHFFMGSCKFAPGQANSSRACPAGSGTDPDAYADETPQHRVAVNAFQMGRTEVTLGQFRRFVEETGNTSLIDEAFRQANEGQGDSTPVVSVSWEDAQSFIAWLNRSKPKSDAARYRLPSEAEWEYAARGGTTTRYFFGDAVEKRFGQFVWYDKNSGNRQRVVGGKKPNAYGLYDMLGNVWEWTADCWNENYQGAPTDGSAWVQGDCNKRVVRGGSWYDVPLYLRAAARFGDRATRRINYDGFRVVRALH